MKRGFWVALFLFAFFANVSCQENDNTGSGSNPDKGNDSSNNKYSMANSEFSTSSEPLKKDSTASSSKSKLSSKRQTDRIVFRNFYSSFLYISTMFYSLQ